MEKLRQKHQSSAFRLGGTKFGGLDAETADRVFDKEIDAGHISAKDVGKIFCSGISSIPRSISPFI